MFCPLSGSVSTILQVVLVTREYTFFTQPLFCLQVEMAHKVLSSDMAELINAMKLAQRYSTTTLDQEYRRGMLSAAHVLAVDAKHLFDVVDAARKQSAKLSSSV